MITVRDVSAYELIQRLKEELKRYEAIKPPLWALFAKTGCHKQRPPEQPDAWWIRCASLLRRLYLNGPVGVERLRSYYGGKMLRGRAPPRFHKASGAWIRQSLQQLERAGLVERVKGGRQLTPKGRSLLNRLAHELHGRGVSG